MKRSEKIDLLKRIAAGKTSLLQDENKFILITKENKIFLVNDGEKEISEENFRLINGKNDFVFIELAEGEKQGPEIKNIRGFPIFKGSLDQYHLFKDLRDYLNKDY